jgi:DNA-binding LacI/PurR family transcriptional regulator
VPLNRQLVDQIDYVTLDNFSAGFKGIEHLWKLGHDRIAIITGDVNASNALATLDGAKKALSHCGVKGESVFIRDGSYSRQKAQRETNWLMRLKNPPTAIFAHDDNMALGVRETLLSLKLKIPADVALIGVDDIETGALSGIELTTISQQKYEMGSIGVKILIDRIEQNTPRRVEKVVLKADLIIRKTCGFYPGGYKR